jgi:hypothetical protein
MQVVQTEVAEKAVGSLILTAVHTSSQWSETDSIATTLELPNTLAFRKRPDAADDQEF